MPAQSQVSAAAVPPPGASRSIQPAAGPLQSSPPETSSVPAAAVPPAQPHTAASAAAGLSRDGACSSELQQLFSLPAALPPGSIDLAPGRIAAGGTAWLWDTHVHNVTSLLSASKGSTGRAGSAAVYTCTAPELVLDSLQPGGHGLRLAIMSGKPVIQTMGEGQHFTAVAVDSLNKRAYLWDPRLALGGGISATRVAAFTAALTAIVPGITVAVWAVDLQRDSHQCGVWAIFYVAMWLVWLRTAGSGCFHAWLEQRVRGDGAIPSGTAAAAAYFGGFRRAAAALQDAAAAVPGAISTVRSTSPPPPGLGTATAPFSFCSPEPPPPIPSGTAGVQSLVTTQPSFTAVTS